MTQETKRSILVTGAAGFIGAHLCHRLLAEGGWRVVGYDNLNSYYDVRLKQERLRWLREADTLGDRFSFVEADLCNSEALEDVFVREEPQIVVNLAAQAGVRWSIDHPRDYIDSNIVGFFNVLEACRHHGVRHLVYASSSSVYGDADVVPFTEDARCDAPVSLYAAAKRSDELLAYSYAQLFALPCTALRFFTVYGPMGRPDMAYFSFAEKMLRHETITLFNRGDMLRDFTFVDDVVEGIMRVICGAAPEGEQTPSGGLSAPHRVFNLGHGSPVHLGEFVRTLEDALRAQGALTGEVHYDLLPMQPGDVHRTYASTQAFEERYAYVPQTSLAEGLDAFAAWYVHAWLPMRGEH